MSLTVLCILVSASAAVTCTQTECQVTGLLCEYQVAPLGIDTAEPRLSWVIESQRRGCRQMAYQILVSQRRKSLSNHVGDTWDSGKVESCQSIHVTYAGKTLLSGTQYFWTVRVWDDREQPSAWSDVATWTCALLDNSDWKAHWIKRPSAATKPMDFAGAEWIWHDEPSWHAAENRQSPPNAPGGKSCYLQHEFEVPRQLRIVSARLISVLDNTGEIWLNGQSVVTLKTWQTATVQNVADLLVPGSNILSAQVTNLAEFPNPAGFVAKLVIEMDDGNTLQIVSDDSWRSSDRQSGQDWQHQVMANWAAAKSLGGWGVEPWGRNVNIHEAQLLPMFRKEFHVRKKIQRALLHVCGLGHYELSLNGDTVGTRFLDPAWSVYEKTVYYTTYDITPDLKPGPNTVGVMLGKGFYDTAGDRRIHFVDVSRPLKLILQTQLEYEDGSCDWVVTDESWRVTAGPITHCAILGGSDFDARRLPPSWNTDDYDDRSWLFAEITNGPGGQLRAAEMPPMTNATSFDPVQIDQVEPGVFVYDFGQNSSARPRLRVKGKPGQTIRLTPAEQRFEQTDRTNDGTGRVNQAGVGKPNYWTYTLRGGTLQGGETESWCPQFTYSGYQYLELTGGVPVGHRNAKGLPVVTQLESVHVRNASPAAGTFECSHKLFNDVDRVIDWAVRSNLAHVLTDCPHREKLGWLEVSYLMGPSIACRYNIARFYTKVTRDIRDSQSADGAIFTVAPHYPQFTSEMFDYTPEWGAAGVVLPWQLYERYGDERILAENFDAMRRFVDYLRGTSRDLIAKPGLGDWCDYGHGQGPGPAHFTPPELTATAIFYHCTDIVARAARILGRSTEHDTYTQLANRIQRQFQATFYDGDGSYQNHGSPQTANAMALVIGLTPPDQKQLVVDRIIADLEARDYQQTAGDVGFHFLVEALARNDRSDVLYRIANRHSKGSYGFVVDRGWTSMPEIWDVNTSASLNHLMLGHIQQWFYQDLLGIQNDPTAVAFKKTIIRPRIVGDLQWARGHYDSMYGRISVHWQRDQDQLKLDVCVPANTTATVYLPTDDETGVTESGHSIANADGVKFVCTQGNEVVLEVLSGTYRFELAVRSK